MKKIFGFTLAEVLITLGIIGVVAAMTIPIISAKVTESRTVNQLKAINSILAQAIRSVQEEDGVPEDWGFEELPEEEGYFKAAASAKISEKLKPVLKVAVDCGLEDPEGRCAPNINYKKLNGDDESNYSESPYYKMVLLNGATLYIRGASSNEQTVGNIYVDLNGKKAPNTFGRDFFQFKIAKNGGLYPSGAPQFTEAKYRDNCKLSSTGYTCTYEVLKNGNMNYLHKK